PRTGEQNWLARGRRRWLGRVARVRGRCLAGRQTSACEQGCQAAKKSLSHGSSCIRTVGFVRDRRPSGISNLGGLTQNGRVSRGDTGRNSLSGFWARLMNV